MPSLTFVSGKLMAAWYDSRRDNMLSTLVCGGGGASCTVDQLVARDSIIAGSQLAATPPKPGAVFTTTISDPTTAPGLRHTIDVYGGFLDTTSGGATPQLQATRVSPVHLLRRPCRQRGQAGAVQRPQPSHVRRRNHSVRGRLHRHRRRFHRSQRQRRVRVQQRHFELSGLPPDMGGQPRRNTAVRQQLEATCRPTTTCRGRAIRKARSTAAAAYARRAPRSRLPAPATRPATAATATRTCTPPSSPPGLLAQFRENNKPLQIR